MSNTQVYVVMRDHLPVAVAFEMTDAWRYVPNADKDTTTFRVRDHRVTVVEYANEEPTDPLWTIHRVDTAPYTYGDES